MRWWIVGAGALALATALALVEGVEIYLGQLGSNPRPSDFTWILGHVLPPWVLIGLLVPVAVWLTHRFPLRSLSGRNVAIHLAAAAGFAMVRLTSLAAVHVLLGDAPGFRADAIAQLSAYFVWDCMIYWCVVSATTAMALAGEARALSRRELALTAELAEARLEALRAQLSPHFFFNVLNTVSSLIAQERPGEAMEVLAQLSDHMRQVLRRQPRTVSLADELTFLRGYVDLQSVRFGDRLRVAYQVAPDAAAALIPPLLLQPLVENALRHGVSRRPGPAAGTISAHRVNGSLELQVEDDGPGLPSGWSLPQGAGAGLRLTLARLRTLSDAATLRVSPRPGGGTIAALSLPFLEQDTPRA
jgi:two-component system LytT family sensor kinase